MDLIELATPYTMTTKERMAAMIEAVQRIDREGILGDIVECGVWRGGNIIIARKLSPFRTCWLFDTFAGMTEPTEVDTNRRGAPAIHTYRVKTSSGQQWAAASLEEVKDSLWETGTLDESRLRFVVGDVVETLKVPDNLPDQIALLRLDTDWYESTNIELDVLWPRVSRGGVMIVDDYGHWLGARRAVDEHFGCYAHELVEIDYTAIQMVKP